MVDWAYPQLFISLRQPHSLRLSDLSEVISCALFPMLWDRLFTTANPHRSLGSNRLTHPEHRLFEIGVRDVGVDHGCGQVGMAQRLLYAPDVAARFEEPSGERVPQGVRTDPFDLFNFGVFGVPLH